MNVPEMLVRRVDELNGKARFFVAAVAVMGLLLIGSSIVAWQSSKEQKRLDAAYTQTMRVLRTTATVKVATLETLRGERGFLLTGRPAELQPYFAGRRELARSLDELDRYVPESNGHDAMYDLRHSAGEFLLHVDEVVRLTRAGQIDRARLAVQRSAVGDVIAAIDRTSDVVIAEERARLDDLQDNAARVMKTLLRFVYLTSFAGLCLLALAVVAAIALRRSFQREKAYQAELRKRAETDELTGVSNRRELLSYLETRMAEARRLGTPLSFAMFDIDNFKRVNDTHGHGVGDEAIRHVVSNAQATVRINDRIGRMGGEEFGIVLPKSSEDNAYMVCERMRARLRGNPFALDDTSVLLVTISTGIASLTEDDDAASLIERADKALYEAKRSGRDVVKLAA